MLLASRPTAYSARKRNVPICRSSPNPKAQNVKLLKIRWARSAWTKPLVTNVAYSWRCTRPYGRSRLRSIIRGARYRPSRPMTRIVNKRSAAAGAPEVRLRSVSMNGDRPRIVLMLATCSLLSLRHPTFSLSGEQAGRARHDVVDRETKFAQQPLAGCGSAEALDAEHVALLADPAVPALRHA